MSTDAESDNNSNVQLVWITPNTQHQIAYCARVSNPENQNNTETEPKLLQYLAKHKHWSPFEMASMCLQIKTTRYISPQILRHRSFSFQEFSQRYAKSSDYSLPPLRRQDIKNRQNSIDDISSEMQAYFKEKADSVMNACFELYNEMLSAGIAKECARGILPSCTDTTLYMTGTIRSWIHYIQLRGGPDTQLEHREIALQAKEILLKECPALSSLFESV